MLPALEIVPDPTSDEGKKYLAAFLAVYAKMRSWPTNARHRAAVAAALDIQPAVPVNDQENILNLIMARRFVILELAIPDLLGKRPI